MDSCEPSVRVGVSTKLDRLVRIMRESELVRLYSRLALFAVLLGCTLMLLGACAGSGEGLDDQGNPVDGDTPGPGDDLPFAPTFSSIQANILVPSCPCHQGAAAPQGLVLNTAATLDMLVNTLSNEMPELFRIEPGNPDDSYLIRKLEGGPNIVGFQMPPTELGEAHLSQAQIDVVRQWIVDGALDN